MYQIKCDNRDGNRPYILHDSRSNNIRVIEPKCELELNRTGTLTFRIQPNHPYFDKIKKLHSEISLYQDGEWIFTGRVLNDEIDTYNLKTVVCEGILAYLLDSTQRNKIYSITDRTRIKPYLTDVLKNHNAQVDDHKQFSVGYITEVDDSDKFYRYSSYEDTLTTINEHLINSFNNTYVSARVSNGVKYIDYLNSSNFTINNQLIIFGQNLLKLNRYVKGEEIATVIIPLGESQGSTDTEDGGTLDEPLDISELPDGLIEGSIYKENDCIYDSEAIKQFGKITKIVRMSNIDNVQDLLKKGIEHLNYYKLLSLSMELTAFDLHLLDVNIDSINVGQKIRVISKPHNINDFMIVEKMTINLDSPDKSSITLASEERSSVDTSSGISKKTSDSNKNVNSIKKEVDNFDYMSPGDFNNLLPDFFNSQLGTGGFMDLSRYATRIEVEMAFSELATLIGGL